MYNIENKYLYEILLDYKESSNKKDVINCFLDFLWNFNCNRTISEKYIKFKVDPQYLNTEIGELFQKYSCIPYLYYKSSTSKKDYANLIKQKINNIYTHLCDDRICTTKEYMELLGTSKRLYYRWINGENYNKDALEKQITESIKIANLKKSENGRKKLKLDLDNYKKIVSGFIGKIFENYISLDDYENKSYLVLDIDLWTEDNFTVKYFCKSLNGYMRNYQKEYYRVKRNKQYKYCNCGGLIDKSTNQYKCNLCKALTEYQPIVSKIIKCIDCGKEVEVDGKIRRKSERCNPCYKKYRTEYNRIKKTEERKS